MSGAGVRNHLQRADLDVGGPILFLVLLLSVLVLGLGVYSWMAGLHGWYSPLFVTGSLILCFRGLLSLI